MRWVWGHDFGQVVESQELPASYIMLAHDPKDADMRIATIVGPRRQRKERFHYSWRDHLVHRWQVFELAGPVYVLEEWDDREGKHCSRIVKFDFYLVGIDDSQQPAAYTSIYLNDR